MKVSQRRWSGKPLFVRSTRRRWVAASMAEDSRMSLSVVPRSYSVCRRSAPAPITRSGSSPMNWRDESARTRVLATSSGTETSVPLGSARSFSRRWSAPFRASAFCSSAAWSAGSPKSAGATLNSLRISRSCSAENEPPPRSIWLKRAWERPSFRESSACVSPRACRSSPTLAASGDGSCRALRAEGRHSNGPIKLLGRQ